MALIETAFARSRTVISALLLVLIAGTIATALYSISRSCLNCWVYRR